jgi:hypothetical protein
MMRAARPAAAAIPANAVWRAPPAEEEEVPVAAWDAAEPALEALEARLDASEPALEASLEREEAMLLAIPAPLLKMVVEPIVEVNVEPPEVSTVTIAEVVTAVENPPAAPAPPVL